MKNANGAKPGVTVFAAVAFPEGISIETTRRVLFLSWEDLAGLAAERGTPVADDSQLVGVPDTLEAFAVNNWPAPVPVEEFTLHRVEA